MTEQNKDGALPPSEDRATAVEPVPVSPLRDGIPSAEEAFHIGVEFAALHLAKYARSLGGKRDWATDSIGWPVDAEGAARREMHAFAGLIEECLQHESLSTTFCSLAQAIEARRAETQSGSVHESAVPEGNAP